jgi:hypothetical protein
MNRIAVNFAPSPIATEVLVSFEDLQGRPVNRLVQAPDLRAAHGELASARDAALADARDQCDSAIAAAKQLLATAIAAADAAYATGRASLEEQSFVVAEDEIASAVE